MRKLADNASELCLSLQMCRSLAQKEGMLVGGSAGLNLHAAVETSKTAKPGSVIVAILADNGVKYLTKIYNNDWIKAKVCPGCSAVLSAVIRDGLEVVLLHISWLVLCGECRH